MIRASWTRIARVTAGVLGLCLVAPALASAQGGPGFLFKQPRVTIKFETGYGIQRTSSDIFEDTRRDLTVGSRDFDAPYIGGELAVRVNERWDVALGVGVVQESVASEYRDWLEGDLPIEQVTEFRTIPITVSAKYYLRDRGRRIGRFAWVPSTLTPYVGAGVGVVSYRFEQTGDFIDFTEPAPHPIFYDQFISSGEAALFRGLAGVTYSLGKQFELTGEARYDLASADLGPRFEDFEPIDLAGFRAVVGVAVRF
jgi:hypothetical protein